MQNKYEILPLHIIKWFKVKKKKEELVYFLGFCLAEPFFFKNSIIL